MVLIPTRIHVFVAIKGGKLFDILCLLKLVMKSILYVKCIECELQYRKYTLTNTISTIASKKRIQKILPVIGLSKVFVLSSRIDDRWTIMDRWNHLGI